MRNLVVLVFAVFVLCGLSVISNAQTRSRYPRNINARQERQQDRIARGISSGSLTPQEAARLERQQTRLDYKEKRFRNSGDGLSPRERAILERDLNRESRRINRQNHDRQHQ